MPDRHSSRKPPSHSMTAPVMKVFSSANFATSPFIVRRTPAIATVPDFIGRVWRDALDLAMSPLPFDVPGYEVSLMWPAARGQDPGLAWLMGEFAHAFGGVGKTRANPR